MPTFLQCVPSRFPRTLLIPAFALLAGCATTAPAPGNADLARQVADTERGFAKSMADRNHAAFVTYLSDEAIFFTGPKPLHGKDEVAAAWRRFYDKPQAPFSWEPDKVEVLASGTLALSSGPVHDPSGKLIANFTSIWRLEAPGSWRIVLVKGNEVCDCEKAP
jgi:ketosteroid isomerase-like protein